jgi:hypothetical protein
MPAAPREPSPTVSALEAFVVGVDGKQYIVAKGQSYPADHPIVKGREELFAKPD